MPSNPNTYSPKQAADLIGCTAQTIRRYTTHFQRHLSEGASPAPGARRELTDLDLYVLRRVFVLARDGETLENIDAILETLTLPEDVQPLALDPSPTPQAIPEALALLTSIGSTLDTLTALQSQQQAHSAAQSSLTVELTQDLQSQAHRLSQLEDAQARRRPDALTVLLWFALGVAVTVAAVGLALWLLA
jgi:DNA-binding transcriptional MerR regulator